jgi:hypothetical protein
MLADAIDVAWMIARGVPEGGHRAPGGRLPRAGQLASGSALLTASRSRPTMRPNAGAGSNGIR